jgi:hypothetical protein
LRLSQESQERQWRERELRRVEEKAVREEGVRAIRDEQVGREMYMPYKVVMYFSFE